MAIKINNIIAQTDREGVLCTPWLERQNISRTEQVQYVHSGWLARIVPLSQLYGGKIAAALSSASL